VIARPAPGSLRRDDLLAAVHAIRHTPTFLTFIPPV
jgi:hypothetical protein